MSDLSSYSFTGRLTKDAEFKTLASGKALLEMSVAVNVGFGSYRTTNWVTAKWWGDRGKAIAPYLVKGALIAASGEMQLKPWESGGKSGVECGVSVSNVQLLQGKKEEGAQEPPPGEPEEVTF